MIKLKYSILSILLYSTIGFGSTIGNTITIGSQGPTNSSNTPIGNINTKPKNQNLQLNAGTYSLIDENCNLNMDMIMKDIGDTMKKKYQDILNYYMNSFTSSKSNLMSNLNLFNMICEAKATISCNQNLDIFRVPEEVGQKMAKCQLEATKGNIESTNESTMNSEQETGIAPQVPCGVSSGGKGNPTIFYGPCCKSCPPTYSFPISATTLGTEVHTSSKIDSGGIANVVQCNMIAMKDSLTGAFQKCKKTEKEICSQDLAEFAKKMKNFSIDGFKIEKEQCELNRKGMTTAFKIASNQRMEGMIIPNNYIIKNGQIIKNFPDEPEFAFHLNEKEIAFIHNTIVQSNESIYSKYNDEKTKMEIINTLQNFVDKTNYIDLEAYLNEMAANSKTTFEKTITIQYLKKYIDMSIKKYSKYSKYNMMTLIQEMNKNEDTYNAVKTIIKNYEMAYKEYYTQITFSLNLLEPNNETKDTDITGDITEINIEVK